MNFYLPFLDDSIDTVEIDCGEVQIPKSAGCREANAFLGCMNLKMRLKFFFEKTKATSMSICTMKSLL